MPVFKKIGSFPVRFGSDNKIRNWLITEIISDPIRFSSGFLLNSNSK